MVPVEHVQNELYCSKYYESSNQHVEQYCHRFVSKMICCIVQQTVVVVLSCYCCSHNIYYSTTHSVHALQGPQGDQSYQSIPQLAHVCWMLSTLCSRYIEYNYKYISHTWKGFTDFDKPRVHNQEYRTLNAIM